MLGQLNRTWRRLTNGLDARNVAAGLIERADAARDAKRHLVAAALYDEALRIEPGRASIHIQCGHMLKEAGDLDGAEARYLQARRLTPADPDLALQLGHLYKRAERFEEAGEAYRRAAALLPGWAEPAEELQRLQAQGRHGEGEERDAAGDRHAARRDADERDGLVPELFAPALPTSRVARPEIKLLHLGRPGDRSRWGHLPVLRGIEAVRGYIVSALPCTAVQLLFDGRLLHTEPLQATALPGELPFRQIFNAWIDLTNVPPRPGVLELRFMADAAPVAIQRQQVVIGAPMPEEAHPQSDGLVTVDGEGGSLVERINAKPSMVRSARRRLFSAPPRTVLLQQTDQLGDLIASVPALRRLRQMLPAARFVGLLSAANQEFAQTLGLFDSIELADFPERDGRRSMSRDVQRALRARLTPYGFDLAIDLSEGVDSRPLLLLSGAPILYGFENASFPWLSVGFTGNTHDPLNGLERVSHSAKILGLVEWLGLLLGESGGAPLPSRGDRSALSSLGLHAGPGFALIHTGARLAMSRWPFYRDLAASILRQTDLDLVVISNQGDGFSALLEEPGWGKRLRVLDEKQPFALFDALVSSARVFIGNDSGPKHLAALRGTPVVSLHMARLNWNEWGQDRMGLVVSRRVPCAGCAIGNEPALCGKDFACIARIKPDEVFGAVQRVLRSEAERTVTMA